MPTDRAISERVIHIRAARHGAWMAGVRLGRRWIAGGVTLAEVFDDWPKHLTVGEDANRMVLLPATWQRDFRDGWDCVVAAEGAPDDPSDL